MEYVQLVLQLVEKLNTTVSKYYERGDIRQDNNDQLAALKQQYASAANVLCRLQTLSSPDFITLERLRLYESTLQRDVRALKAWEQSIHKAKRTDRVKRMQQILSACDTNVKQLFQFMSERISPMLEAQASNQDVYTPRNTVPRNPPRLILDYSTTDTCEGQLKAAVTAKSNRRIVGVVASGKGGVGKTCALRGLAVDAEVRQTFRGGCLYIELGNDATLATLVNAIANIVERTGGANLAKAIRTEESLQVAATRASDWFSRQSCLFLVDDIWQINGIDCTVLTILGSMVNENSKLVYSTRDRHFLNGVDKVVEFLEKEPCGDLSRRMLKRHAGFKEDCKLNQTNEDSFQALLRICQGLPLAFGVVGGSVLTISRRKEEGKKQEAWSDFHRDFCSTPNILFTASTLEYGPLSKLVDTSLQVVEREHELEDYSKRFRSFCVLQKQQNVPDRVLQKLWNLERLEDTQRAVSIFEEVSLVQVRRDGDTLYVRLNDLILDLAVRKASESLELQTIFESLCRNYLPVTRRNNLRYEWWHVEDDGYIYDNLCRLLQSAGKIDELLWLLSKPQWIVKRFVDGGISSVEQDVRLGEEIARHITFEHSDRMVHLEAVRKAARKSCAIVGNNPREVWFQLHGRLLFHAIGCDLTKRFVEEIEECAPRPWVKASLGLLQPPGAAVEMILCPGRVRCISVETDGLWVFWVNHRDEQFEMGVTCYKSETGAQYTQRFACHGIDGVDCCAFLRDGKSVATAHQGVRIFIWNRRTGKRTQEINCEHKVRGLPLFCRCLVDENDEKKRFIGFSSDGRRVASASSRHAVQIWETMSGKAVTQPLVGHTDWVGCVALSEDGNRIASGSLDKTVRVWDARGEETVTQPLVGHIGGVKCVAMSADGSRIVSGSEDNTVRVWDARSGVAVTQALVEHTDWVRCVAVSADGSRIVSGSDDKTMRVWDARTGETVTEALIGHTDWVLCVALSEDGSRIVSGSRDKTVRVWNAHIEKASKPSKSESGAPDLNEEVAFSRHQRYREPALCGHTDLVLCVALSADGRRIVSGSRDKTVRVWDAHSGEAVGMALGHGRAVYRVGVDAQCSKIVSFDRDGSGRLWDVGSGECVLTSYDAAWRSTVDALAMRHSRDLMSFASFSGTQVRDGDLLLATCDEAVESFGDGHVYFSRDFGKRCRLLR